MENHHDKSNEDRKAEIVDGSDVQIQDVDEEIEGKPIVVSQLGKAMNQKFKVDYANHLKPNSARPQVYKSKSKK